jgi:hypothetical protein
VKIMPEIPMSPEVQEMLPKAVKEVENLYLGDQLSNLLRIQTPEQRDKFWKETANKFGPFSEKIIGLREAIKNADTTKRTYPPSLTSVMRLHFSNVEDQMARELLTDLLFARTITSPGYMDYEMRVVDEAVAMATELGSEEGLQGEVIRSVDLHKIIESVLSGNLKLTRQTQLKKE